MFAQLCRLIQGRNVPQGSFSKRECVENILMGQSCMTWYFNKNAVL